MYSWLGGYSDGIHAAWAKHHGLTTGEIHQQKRGLRMAAIPHEVEEAGISDMTPENPVKLPGEAFETMWGQ